MHVASIFLGRTFYDDRGLAQFLRVSPGYGHPPPVERHGSTGRGKMAKADSSPAKAGWE